MTWLKWRQYDNWPKVFLTEWTIDRIISEHSCSSSFRPHYKFIKMRIFAFKSKLYFQHLNIQNSFDWFSNWKHFFPKLCEENGEEVSLMWLTFKQTLYRSLLVVTPSNSSATIGLMVPVGKSRVRIPGKATAATIIYTKSKCPRDLKVKTCVRTQCRCLEHCFWAQYVNCYYTNIFNNEVK